MKKKLLLIFVLLLSLFTITGCTKKSNKTASNAVEKEKVTFTEEVNLESSHVKYKLPKEASYGLFKDLGKSCQVAHYTNQVSVAALYPYDDKVDKIDKITINGFNYETYKYVENLGTTYIYRTKINNDYHLFQYFVSSQEYDDSQPLAFMNTVEYLYNSIDYKQ